MKVLHSVYLPFKENVFKKHFIEIDNKKAKSQDQHLKYFKNSIARYKEYELGKKIPGNKIAFVRQIEKDEKFWTASTFLTLFYSKSFISDLTKILISAYGNKPPIKSFQEWSECLEGNLHVYFEPNLPSPKSYLFWLKERVNSQHLIPYIIDKAKNKKDDFRMDLEGPTNVDAMIINSTNGFAVITEAKVLSDISYQVSYDMKRNQIIRNIDVMLDKNDNLNFPLNKRVTENSLFLLLTPEAFKKNPKSRLYGYKFNDYKSDSISLKLDLPHRSLQQNDWDNISSRIGWTTWEELRSVNSDCCRWL